jgi:hypothetical protein
MPEQDVRDEELERIEWRETRLVELGIDRGLAIKYASTVDYHDVEALMERGHFTADQALELLHP